MIKHICRVDTSIIPIGRHYLMSLYILNGLISHQLLNIFEPLRVHGQSLCFLMLWCCLLHILNPFEKEVIDD